MCYDCENAKDGKTIYYQDDCIADCSEIYGIHSKDNNTCISCKDLGLYYSFNDKKCTDKCKGELDEYLGTCIECHLFHPARIYFNETVDTPFFQNGKCVEQCNNEEGYGFYHKYIDKREDYNYILDITYCARCIEEKLFLKDQNCSSDCGEGFIIDDGHKGICNSCGKEKKYVEKIDKCLDKCPPNSRVVGNNNTCTFCLEKEFYYQDGDKDGKCLKKCESYQIINYTSYSIYDYTYNYSECIDSCEEHQIVVDNKCVGCDGNNYFLH